MTDLIVLDRTHAAISPSSYARIRKCTASVALSASAPPEAASPYADAGSAAHKLLEVCLQEGLDTFELGGVGNVRVKGRDVPVDHAMLDDVAFCLDWIRCSGVLDGRQLECEVVIPISFAEQYLGRPIYGHADVLARPIPVVVVDAKFGYNPVPASSPQNGLYILGAVLAETKGDLDREGLAGTSVILQPSAGAPDRHEWTFAALRELRDEVIDVCRKVRRKQWEYAHGEWCRFCPALAVCPHLAAVARDSALAKVVPTPELVASGEMSAGELDALLELWDVLELKGKQLNAMAEDYLRYGGRLKTRKLVRKRTVRRWRADKDAEFELKAAGINPYTDPQLISPAEAERRLPPAKQHIVKQLSEKPEGELTIAKAGDKGEAVVVAEALKSALESNVAAGYLAAGRSRTSEAKETQGEAVAGQPAGRAESRKIRTAI